MPDNDEMEAELKQRYKGILQGAPRSTTFVELGTAAFDSAQSLATEAVRQACTKSKGEFCTIEEEEIGHWALEQSDEEGLIRVERPPGTPTSGVPARLPGAGDTRSWHRCVLASLIPPPQRQPPIGSLRLGNGPTPPTTL